MDEKYFGRKINLFVLDVEGFEMEALQGMVGSKYLPEIMCVEYPHVGLDNLKTFLKNLGYRFDTLRDNNAYFIKNDTNL